ncbi:hypothetical protein ANS017_33290 [Paraclostridium bifermentans]|uniref:hypothetical protein n=1 Tax=Paraclostridium bifermentans TaxID=1490 RepID=UPI001FF52D05|nr:hypothetical protein [Paraclostridium bifermentans]UOW66435.1 hypothetical protein MTR78_07690 [Paraclostridium bifermentans]GKZ04839.1 hypothetical protein ANS014_32730 [Paraclostridium bifermentans]GKZ06376.1 hypothetical protein ANS015_12590 [Paraclostridium bifermentans]GKZ11945.1 hypothetical protein ANS017_33290 [Paraclostridium bifermentans]
MKKTLVSIVAFITIIMFSNINSYANIYVSNAPNNTSSVEEKYLNELTSIGSQVEILASNSLNSVINKKDPKDFLKEALYIKTQIRELRIMLSDYHKEKSGDEEKNPFSLGLLNTLNYYSMSLSFLTLFLQTQSISDRNEYLENYYFSKADGDQTLAWAKGQIK